VERVVLGNKGMSGWQNFFNDIPLGFAGKPFVP
jgi:hypothetical protein